MGTRAGWMVLGAIVGAIGPARARADGLAGLEAKLRETGRIGTPAPQSAGPIPAAAPEAGAAERARDPRQASARIEDDRAVAAAARPPAVYDEDLQHTDGAVVACRIEVARRRRLPPAKIAAGTVVLRFTIEMSGRVHEAEALSAVDTDLEVAACAKRVLSEWTFPRRARDRVVVERTYRFSRS
jgi:hypothetical protein